MARSKSKQKRLSMQFKQARNRKVERKKRLSAAEGKMKKGVPVNK